MALLPRIVRASPTEALAARLRSASCLPVRSCRLYATPHGLGASPKSSTNRRQVTVANDNGHVRWGDLTATEKVARSTQQSFNFLVVIAGVLATGAVGYVIYSEVLSPEGTTNQYHRALKRIKEDPKCVELLGDPKKIVAHGEVFHSRMARAWSITSKKEKDRAGNEHLYLRFYVDGPLNRGTVFLHMIQRPGEQELDYQSLTLDVPGHKRIVLEDDSWSPLKKKSGKLFGVRWW
ncbi:mitochondrial import inner membrane translocase subunit tim21 [Diplodia corticola]|uniref:Mitochondrial import inner membrane translocase subunit Tim21 n=1 Tax=Diplodia corticola TaxID=236234 RepID=A0A1J9QL18_9PEZI|nr:mitochondrial import inner membrane translocase subunit tim21 [Diplodia corticola]OJD29582.1 mitochondrial import inner membrane translocase subunit tim21 [Diplodia corticola]